MDSSRDDLSETIQTITGLMHSPLTRMQFFHCSWIRILGVVCWNTVICSPSLRIMDFSAIISYCLKTECTTFYACLILSQFGSPSNDLQLSLNPRRCSDTLYWAITHSPYTIQCQKHFHFSDFTNWQ